MLRTKSASILKRIPAQDDGVIEVYRPDNIEIDGVSHQFSGCIENIRCKASIKSMSAAAPPEGIDELGQIAALESFKEWQWNSQRIHLKLLKLSTSSPIYLAFNEIGVLPISPFYTIDLMPLITRQPYARFAPGDRLAVQVVDAGYGLLADIDELIVYGDVLEELHT